MRNSKPIEIDEVKITVHELTVEEIINIGQNKALKDKSTDLSDFKALFEIHLPKALTGVTFDELVKMAPSDLKQIYDTFKEVNSVFFAVARSVGLGELLNQVIQAIQKDFLRLLADSFLPGTKMS